MSGEGRGGDAWRGFSTSRRYFLCLGLSSVGGRWRPGDAEERRRRWLGQAEKKQERGRGNGGVVQTGVRETGGIGVTRPRSACLFIDGNLLAVQKAAARLGLPTLVLRTGSAACLGSFLTFPKLYEMGYLPRQQSQLYMPVKELPPLRVRDLFFSIHSSQEKVRKVLARITETVKGSSGVIINTSEALEINELERIHSEVNVPMVLAAGPLHKLSSTSTGAGDQDYNCIKWLDTQPGPTSSAVASADLARVPYCPSLHNHTVCLTASTSPAMCISPPYASSPTTAALPSSTSRRREQLHPQALSFIFATLRSP
ncbi:hypothetical protein PR202_ga27866 [Eleusine coracana subsp. coracana]|uniref:Uncharacterized protein n=1 Tax=Eleusine coracana subsp. coracana TaxID=191504 RepID=A0AAV5DFV6_ELECO|nr:hypothetical protein PR202_ga27866 [Eleusine coracana subsp. coracana]